MEQIETAILGSSWTTQRSAWKGESIVAIVDARMNEIRKKNLQSSTQVLVDVLCVQAGLHYCDESMDILRPYLTAVRKVQIVSELTLGLDAAVVPVNVDTQSLHRDDPFCSKLLRGKEVKIKSGVDGACLPSNRSSNVQRRSTTQPLHCVLCMEVATVGSSIM
jgi:hypothetical protein